MRCSQLQFERLLAAFEVPGLTLKLTGWKPGVPQWKQVWVPAHK